MVRRRWVTVLGGAVLIATQTGARLCAESGEEPNDAPPVTAVAVEDATAVPSPAIDEPVPNGEISERLLIECPDDSCVGEHLDGPRFNVGGWLEQGFTWNPDSPRSRFNFPNGFNDRSNEYQLNQLYLFVEKKVDTQGCSWDVGGRVDLLYGTDYYFTEALGLETELDGTQKWNSDHGPRQSSGLFVGGIGLYGVAMPQLYAEVFVPVGNGLSVKLGHFYTIIGYESVMAPENFFYSHSYLRLYGEPFTHTGGLASYPVNDRITLQGGFTRGWDTWEDNNENLAFLGGVTWTSCSQCTSVAFAVHTGEEMGCLDFEDHHRDIYSLVFTHKLNDCLTYTFQNDIGWENEGSFNRQGVSKDAEWYGIDQSLIYDCNDCLSVGARFEWFRDDDHRTVLRTGAFAEGGNYFDLTVGANWRPYDRVTIRPEARWDWSNSAPDGRRGAFDDFSDKNQFTAAIDVIWKF